MSLDILRTAIANSDARARQAYRNSYRKMWGEFDGALSEYDRVGGIEARDLVFSEYKRILVSILNTLYGLYTTWYCYLALRPYLKKLRRHMIDEIAYRFGADVFDGELNLFLIIATERVLISKKNRGEFKRLRQITFPEGLYFIGNDAFGFFKINYIYIPDSVAEIDKYAFLGCNRLKQVGMGTGVKKIGTGAFGGCHKILHIKYRGTLQDWEAHGFTDIASPWMRVVVECTDGKTVIKEKK